MTPLWSLRYGPLPSDLIYWFFVVPYIRKQSDIKCHPRLAKTNLTSHMRQAHTHYSDLIMSVGASQITGISIVYSNVCSGADHWLLWREFTGYRLNSPLKRPVTRKMFPFDNVIMKMKPNWHRCHWRDSSFIYCALKLYIILLHFDRHLVISFMFSF